MSAGGIAGTLGALLFVLALLGVALHVLRRLTGGTSSHGASHLSLAVLRRLSLGPRQGIAVVRIGEHVVVLSTGDGGVRRVLDLTPAEVEQASAAAARSRLALVPRRAGGAMPPASPAARGITFVERLQVAMRHTLPFAVVVMGVAFATAIARPAAAQGITAPQTRPLIQGTPRQPAVARLPALLSLPDTGAAHGPQLDLHLGNDGDGGLHLSGPVGTIVMLGLLTMLPMLVLLMTSFTRILIVLQLLRQALGTQSAPPGHLIAAFALLLTGFVMAPTLAEANRTAIEPWLHGQMEQTEMLETAVVPFRHFMLRQTRGQDLNTFISMSDAPVAAPDSVSLPILVSAFATSELRSAFEIGFVLFLPFIIIDIVVAAVLMSMGMFMLPPAMISLPFKLLLFVLVDGWTLIVQSLVASFH